MKKSIIAVSLLAALSLTSCGSNSSSSSDKAASQASSSTAAVITESISAEDTSSAAATEQVTAPQQEVGYEGMEAVTADALNDGEYHINVDSSSSMFKIADCILHVEDGSMTADIIIASKSYDALFMGTKEEAEGCDAAMRITYTENESGQSVFTVPVEALDKEIQCASLSAKKQEWYSRTLVFRADSLPDAAFKEKRYKTVSDLGLENGLYTVEVKLEGGSGRASVESPAQFIVSGDEAEVHLIWSSDKYDYMMADGWKYLNVSNEGNSAFDIPIVGFDYKMPVSADTTAMSTPHLIDYTLYFDSSTIEKCE